MYPIKKLGEIVKITKGKKVNYFSDKKKYNYIDIGILRSNEIIEFTDDDGVSCKKEDILIAWDGSKSGTVGYGLEGIIGSTLARLEIIENNIYTPYIGEFLKGQFDYLNKNTSGAAIPHIRKEVLVGLEIPLPPLATQKLIVAKLDEAFAQIDEAIDLTQKNIQSTDDLIKSTLDEAFEEGEGKYGLIKLQNICDLITDGSHYSPKTVEKGLPYVTVRDIDDEGNIDILNCKMVNEEDFTSLIKGNCQPIKGDILFSKDGTVGKVALIREENIVVLSSLAIIRGNEKTYSKYLYWMFLSTSFQKQAIGNKTGAAIKRIILRTIKELVIPLPPLSKQQEIVSYLDQIFAQTKQLKSEYEAKLSQLKELKSSILQSAFEGKLI